MGRRRTRQLDKSCEGELVDPISWGCIQSSRGAGKRPSRIHGLGLLRLPNNDGGQAIDSKGVPLVVEPHLGAEASRRNLRSEGSRSDIKGLISRGNQVMSS